MPNDVRFGLPLSLVEALRIDPSPDARMLADLLDDEPVPPTHAAGEAPSNREASGLDRKRTWRRALVRRVLAGFAMAAGLGAQSHAAGPGLEGRWVMAPAESTFREDVTGPAPDGATMVVSRDDLEHLSYRLVESREGKEVARGDYDVSFAGAPSTSSANGAKIEVAAQRDQNGDPVILAPSVAGVQALIRLRQTGRNVAVLEHYVQSQHGAVRVERISLVRADTVASAN